MAALQLLCFPYTETAALEVRVVLVLFTHVGDKVLVLRTAHGWSVAHTPPQPAVYVENVYGGETPLLVSVPGVLAEIGVVVEGSAAEVALVKATTRDKLGDALQSASPISSTHHQTTVYDKVDVFEMFKGGCLWVGVAVPGDTGLVLAASFCVYVQPSPIEASLTRLGSGSLELVNGDYVVLPTTPHHPTPVEKTLPGIPEVANEEPVHETGSGTLAVECVLTTDGPSFRNTITQLDAQVPAFRALVKDAHAKARAFMTALQSMDKLAQGLSTSLLRLADHRRGVGLLGPAVNGAFVPFLAETRQRAQMVSYNCKAQIVDPLGRLTTGDKDQHAAQKKDFEDESKEYYAWLNRYLSLGKTKDAKYLAKRKLFETAKLDYLDYLYAQTRDELARALLLGSFYFFKDVDSDHQFMTPQLVELIEHTVRQLALLQKARATFREQIAAAASDEELSLVLELQPTRADEEDVVEDDVPEPEVPVDAVGTHSGLMFALGGQGKQGWHKEWVVLERGHLFEYSDWRRGISMRLHEPVNLALSSIKPATYEKRRNCIEILTSSGDKHVLQAMSEADQAVWIKRLFEARQDMKPLNRSGTVAPSIALSNLPNHLEVVQSVDPLNQVCADCRSRDQVEWVLINFLVVFCVNCSGCHRSLGLHITKIKLLKLDNFSPEWRELLTHVNNQRANTYLEARMTAAERIRLPVAAPDRQAFITKKYRDRGFAVVVEDPDAMLLTAVRNREYEEILTAIAAGADVNMTVAQQELTFPLFEYALKKYSGYEFDPVFDISELLVLNGALVGERVDTRLELLPQAAAYWQKKVDRGRTPEVVDTGVSARRPLRVETGKAPLKRNLSSRLHVGKQ